MKQSIQDKRFNIINLIFITLLFITLLYPLVYVISASISSPTAVVTGKMWLFPVDMSFGGYTKVFENPNILRGYMNSLFYMIVGTFTNLIFTVLLAYPLSRSHLKGRKIFLFICIFAMLFTAGIVPGFLLIRNLGLLDKRAVMILPKMVNTYNAIIMITYFKEQISPFLNDAAKIDGCNEINFLWRIVLPLSKPIMAVVVLFTAVAHWNSYFDALIYLRSADLQPLQIVLRNILVTQSSGGTMKGGNVDIQKLMKSKLIAQQMKFSLIIVSTLPLMIMYPFVQKHFVKGLMIGSVKG